MGRKDLSLHPKRNALAIGPLKMEPRKNKRKNIILNSRENKDYTVHPTTLYSLAIDNILLVVVILRLSIEQKVYDILL